MKKLFAAALIVLSLFGCSTDAEVASYNLSKAAEQFQVERRIVFYDAIQGVYLLSIEGRCAIKVDRLDVQLEVTCKTAPNEYKKHFLGISDNVMYFAEQLQPSVASLYHYKVSFRPQILVPDVDLAAGK